MKDIVLIKAYGHFRPAGRELYRDIETICRQAIPQPPGGAASLEGDLLRLSFEGICFPAREVLECLERELPPGACGRLDMLDMEGWRLERHDFIKGSFSSRGASLNQVLDHSGF